MIPLNFASEGEELVIKRIGGKPDVKKHLEDLGFVVGGIVTVVTQTNGNVIVNIKDSRIAISSEMAQKIMV
ncbi:MAG: ferrous iron transport protein A [Clostridia bacterium]|nr:ferrous iron transport protein A [Clostridia bacterium]